MPFKMVLFDFFSQRDAPWPSPSRFRFRSQAQNKLVHTNWGLENTHACDSGKWTIYVQGIFIMLGFTNWSWQGYSKRPGKRITADVSSVSPLSEQKSELWPLKSQVWTVKPELWPPKSQVSSQLNSQVSSLTSQVSSLKPELWPLKSEVGENRTVIFPGSFDGPHEYFPVVSNNYLIREK